MVEVIEAALTAPGGIADCRLEWDPDSTPPCYDATILYPTVVNGYSRSEIYCHRMVRDVAGDAWVFGTALDGIVPKIQALQQQISDAILAAFKG
jgi:hypothetical protein